MVQGSGISAKVSRLQGKGLILKTGQSKVRVSRLLGVDIADRKV
jgi:hypothetical protein